MLIQQLKQAGLADKEAKVYLASLEIGSDTAQEIAKKAGVNRATAYVEIDKLMKKGLMSSFEKGKKTFFQAEDPKQLLSLLDQQEDEIKNKLQDFKKYLPELEGLFNLMGEMPKVRFFEGIEGIKAVQNEFLKTKSHTEVESFCPVDDLLAIFPNHFQNYSPRRIKKKIFSRFLYTTSRGAFLPREDKSAFREAKFIPPEKFPIASDAVIFEDKVAITTLKGKMVGVIIEDKYIAQTLRALFYIAWEAADQYQK